MKELIEIQRELKAPKNQKNKFGNFMYRSAEDILEALKPILHKNKCYLSLSDSIEIIGERYYVKSTAKITNSEGLTAETTAFAREEETKKGMDASQVTGASSSYARKYALNGLFAIDDGKDNDTLSEAPTIDEALALIAKATTVENIKFLFETYDMFHTNEAFKKACTKRKEDIQNAK